MTAAEKPKFNEFYSSATIPTRSAEDTAESIVGGLNENASFRARFYASRNSGDVIIKSLTPGMRFNIDFHSSDAGITLHSTSDSIDQYRGKSLKDYAVHCSLYINSAGDFGSTLDRTNSTRVGQFEDLWSSDNNNYFGVNGILKNFVTTPLPSATTEVQLLTGALVNFYLIFGDKYDEFRNNFNRKFLVGQSAISWAINSSLNYLTENNFEPYTINNDDLLNNGTTTVPGPLTTAPNPKLTRPDQKEFITILYHNYPSITDFVFNRNFYAQVRAEYWDGTNSSETMYLDTAIYSGGTYLFDVSPANIGINVLNFSKKVKKYTVRICVNSNHYLGEVQLFQRTYLYEQISESKNPYNIIFLESLGGWASWYFLAESIIDSSRKITEFTSPVSFSPSIQDEVSSISSIELNKEYKANSGFIDKDHLNWLKTEIDKSTDVRVMNSNGEYESIIIIKSEGKYLSEQNLFNLEIEFKKTVQENYIRK